MFAQQIIKRSTSWILGCKNPAQFHVSTCQKIHWSWEIWFENRSRGENCDTNLPTTKPTIKQPQHEQVRHNKVRNHRVLDDGIHLQHPVVCCQESICNIICDQVKYTDWVGQWQNWAIVNSYILFSYKMIHHCHFFGARNFRERRHVHLDRTCDLIINIHY